jgi:hypothetical protein
MQRSSTTSAGKRKDTDMAKRGREAMAKRAREQARQQKREDKQERIEARGEPAPKLTPDDEAALLEEFARLNDEFASDLVTQSHFAEERHRIMVALGIETEEDS